MPFIKLECNECGNKKITTKTKLGDYDVLTFECGHINYQKVVDNSKDNIYLGPSHDGKSPFPFQVTGIHFALDSNVRCLIADEMGLGKTVQGLLTVRSRPEELMPCAVFVKSKVKFQWAKEIVRWCGREYFPCIVESGKEKIPPGFKFYIFSQDLLRRRQDLVADLKELGIKTIIIDEVQHIKNHQSQRAVAVRKICKEIQHIIALSGTPIKNRAPEYFSILNILRPDMFPVYERFCYTYCDTYNDSYGRPKYGGLSDPKRFFDKTRDFIIRREWPEVFPEFPSINRQFKYSDLGEKVQAAYDKLVEEFTEYYDGPNQGSSMEKYGNIMAFMSKMRHLTGLAKIEPCVDYVMDFLLDTTKQIAVFVHHKDVHQLVNMQILDSMKELGMTPNLISLEADINPGELERRKSSFMNGESRVLVASTLAFGEGLNLQCASDWIIAERQWNPANEEQAERRFARLGQESKVLNSIYLVALGTIDEYLAEIVEKKRAIFANTMRGDEINWEESDIMNQLAERVAASGRKKWKF